jgi:hypothetical protein
LFAPEALATLITGAAPSGASPSAFLVFTDPFTSQTDNFCLDCHTGLASLQEVDHITNRSYASRAGGWTSDTVDGIAESFDASGSTHWLADIQSFFNDEWCCNSHSNPCTACHNLQRINWFGQVHLR